MQVNANYRLIAAVTVCVVLSAAMIVVQRGYSFTVTESIASLSNAPMRVGEWTAEEAELTEAEFGVLNAAEVASLRFTNPIGKTAFMHVATWTDPDEVAETCPHHPGVCYVGNGWFSIDTRNPALEVEGVGAVPIEISLMDRDGERLVIAFSYSMGGQRFATETDARLVQTKFWGQQEWPSVTKYLIQVNAVDIDAALPDVEELLGEFIRWHESENAAVQGNHA